MLFRIQHTTFINQSFISTGYQAKPLDNRDSLLAEDSLAVCGMQVPQTNDKFFQNSLAT